MAQIVDKRPEVAKENALETILRSKMVTRERAGELIQYWKHAVKQANRLDEHGAVKKLVDRLKKDTDQLKEIREFVRMHRDHDKLQATEPILQELLRVLDLLFDKLKKRWWQLRRQAWAYIATLNTAFPKRHPLHDKDKAKEARQQQQLQEQRRKKDDDPGAEG